MLIFFNNGNIFTVQSLILWLLLDMKSMHKGTFEIGYIMKYCCKLI